MYAYVVVPAWAKESESGLQFTKLLEVKKELSNAVILTTVVKKLYAFKTKDSLFEHFFRIVLALLQGTFFTSKTIQKRKSLIRKFQPWPGFEPSTSALKHS